MKKCILLVGMLLVSVVSLAQYRVSTVGESKIFVMTNLDNDKEESYQREYIKADINHLGNIVISTAMGAGDGRPFAFSRTTGIPYDEFRDGNDSDATFANAAAVITWFRDNTGFKTAGGSASSTVKYKADDYTALSAISSPTTGDVAIVTDEGIAGTFVYDSTLSATDNGGTIIDGWVRVYEGNVKSGWWDGGTAAALQSAIDFVEGQGGGTLELTRKYFISTSDIEISGAVEFILLGQSNQTRITFEDSSYGIVVGNESTTTNKEIFFKNVRLLNNNETSTLLKIVNHVRFHAENSGFYNGLNGVEIYSTGSGNYGYDINFSDCDFDQNEGSGMYIHSEDSSSFMNLVNISGCFFNTNGTNLKIDANAGQIQTVNVVNAYLDNNDNTKNLLDLSGDVVNARFTNVTFDGVTGGVDQIEIAADVGSTYFKSCSFDGVVNDLSSTSSFDSDYIRKTSTITDNQVLVATGNGTAEGTSGLTYSGSILDVNGNLTVNGQIYNDNKGSGTFFGVDAGKSDNGSRQNTAFGYRAMEDVVTGTRNVAIGHQAMLNVASDISDNLAIGNSAVYQISSGVANFGIGRNSLFSLGTGTGNVGVGYYSLFGLTTASYNTAIGNNAGAYATSGNNGTGTNSVFMGAETKADADGQTNQIVIGYNVTGNGSNTVTIGNSSITDNYFSGTVNSGQFKLSSLNTAPSSASDTGTTGEIRVTADAIYICTATDTWVKADLATW